MGDSAVKGIDVSGYNPGTDWSKVKSAGNSFAFIKATEGLTYHNSFFRNDWANCKSNGLLRGAYHFFHPSMDPVQQAKWFFNAVGPLSPGDLPPVIDMETHELTIQEEVASTLLFLNETEKLFNKKPMIYAGYYYIQDLGNPPAFAQYPLWLAAYTAIPKIPKPWSNYTFWQYLGDTLVDGVRGTCDLSIGSGDLAWLTNFSNQ